MRATCDLCQRPDAILWGSFGDQSCLHNVMIYVGPNGVDYARPEVLSTFRTLRLCRRCIASIAGADAELVQREAADSDRMMDEIEARCRPPTE